MIADLGGRDRIGFHVGLFSVVTMTDQMIGPFVLGSTMDLLGTHGMLVGAAVVFGLGTLLLRVGRRALPDDPRALATGTDTSRVDVGATPASPMWRAATCTMRLLPG